MEPKRGRGRGADHEPTPVTIPDYDYWRKLIDCQEGCPVHTDARGYVREISAGNFEAAYLIARGPNPLASMCGRVCGASCEAACRRGRYDESIAIRALKRAADEHGGAGLQASLAVIERLRAHHAERTRAAASEVGSSEATREPATERRVAIIGAGPAGLAAAHDLALLGIRSVIYELEQVPGGMLYLGVPEYRLPREVIRAETSVIEAMGVDIRYGVKVGEDVSLAELRAEHGAVLVSIGAKLSGRLAIPGADAPNVVGAVEFLRAVALGEPAPVGRRIVVIGGGDVAFDVARSSLRRYRIDHEGEAPEIHLVCVEAAGQMRASGTEVREGQEEGIHVHNGYGPRELRLEGGRAVSVDFSKVTALFDGEGRFAPQYDEGERLSFPADTVFMAVGQAFDLSFIDAERDSIPLSRFGLPEIDPFSLQCTAKDVFLAGDIAHGPRLMIDAIASGKKAARSIFRYLTGREAVISPEEAHELIEGYTRESGFEVVPRTEAPTVDVDERTRSTSLEVERAYAREAARLQASRCFDCGINTIFDGTRCILCGGCEDVCPTLCLQLVDARTLAGTDYARLLAGLDLDDPAQEVSAIIKNESVCIRCGLCAERCPVAAVTMEHFCFKETLRTQEVSS